MDRKIFFDVVRVQLFDRALQAPQVDGMGRILDEWERRKLSDRRWLAYMLATVFHETGEAMVPVREAGGEAYLKRKRYYPWVGEGLVQVTWEANARKFGAQEPGDCMSWPVALRALFDGMIDGMFTGVGLGRYFGVLLDDPIGARRIINGSDRAALIAGYHHLFLHALDAGLGAPSAVKTVAKPSPTKVPAQAKKAA